MKTRTLLNFFAVLSVSSVLGLEAGQSPSPDLRAQIDVQPSSRQVPYSPAADSVARVNPPPFVWVPVEGEVTYFLQVSKNKEFMSEVITQRGIDISTHALNQALEPGEWFWRYGVEGKEDVTSKPRRFVVPVSAQRRVYPGIERVLDAIPRGRPRLFILSDEVGTYRYRARYGDLQDLSLTISRECDEHLGEKLIEEPPFSDLEDYNYFAVVPPPIDLMEKFAVAYLLTGEEKYGAEAKRRLLHFCSWDPEGSTSDRYNDEPAMWILMRGLRAYDQIYPLLTKNERDGIEDVMRVRARQFYQRLKYRPGREYHSYNYGSHEGRILGFLGQAALCFAHEWDEAPEWLDYVLTVYWNLWPAWARDDGGWHQGPNYWGLYINFALHFAVELKKATGIDLLEKPFFRNTPYFKLYTNPPYAKISPFGDGEHHPPIPGKHSTYDKSGETMYHFSTLLSDPYLRWYANHLGAGPAEYLMGVVLKNDLIRGKPPLDLPQSRYFPGVGLVSLHTALGRPQEDIHFLFHSDPYGNVSHSHPDQNGFTLEAFGEPLAIASGYYPWYASKHHKNWSWQTKSSNCITVDGGIGQTKEAGSSGQIVLFREEEFHDYILGDATGTYKGTLNKFLRHVVHIRPGLYVIIDELEAPKPVTFEWWLHALSEMQLDEETGAVTVAQGDARLAVQFIQPEKLDMVQFSGFPDPPEINKNPMNVTMGVVEPDQWHVTVSTRTKSSTARFIVLLIPYRLDSRPQITPPRLDGDTLELGFDAKEYSIHLGARVVLQRTGK